jgi:hypothetical protein
MAKDAKDNKTLDWVGVKMPRGRVPSGNAVSAAERKAQSRARQRESLRAITLQGFSPENAAILAGYTPSQLDLVVALSRMSPLDAQTMLIVAGAMRSAKM